MLISLSFRALHWFFRNNFKALNRPVVSTFVTLNQDGRKSKRSRYNNHYCSKRATLGFAFVVAALSKDKGNLYRNLFCIFDLVPLISQ